MRTIKTLFIVAFVIISNILLAQKSITGTITDKKKSPISGANISVVDTQIATKTDSLGRYRIEVPNGFVVLRVEKEGFGFEEVVIEKNVINVSLTSAVKLTELGLEDLMNIKVSSSTKSSITIQKAPSVIRVFTAKDFAQKGWYTLGDVLATIPGIQMSEYRMGHQLVWVRGVQSRYNNKLLLLIDGMPMRDNFYGNFQTNEMIPLDMVEKIEVISGPGSVLYGANGLSGIISITTKSSGKSAGMRVGSDPSGYGVAEYDYKGWYANVSALNSDGFSPMLNYDGKVRSHPQEESGQNVLLKYHNKSWMLSGGYSNFNTPYRYNKSNQDAVMNLNPIYFNGKYNFDMREKGSLVFSGYINYYGFQFDKVFYNSDNSINRKLSDFQDSYLLGSELDYQVAIKKHSLSTGLSFMNDKAMDIREMMTYENNQTANREVPYDVDPNVSRNTTGLFLQDVWALNKNILLTSGVRCDVLSKFDDQFSYRIGLTGQSNSNYYGKLLYGTAYRVPYYREYLYVYTHNQALQPEHLRTLEFQVGRMFKKTDVNLTFFYNNYSDFIAEMLVDSILEPTGMRVVDDEFPDNFKMRKISGLELNISFNQIKNLSLDFGGSCILKATELLGDLEPNIYYSSNVSITPTQEMAIYSLAKYTANFTVSYKLFDKFIVGFNGLLIDKRNMPDNYQASAPIAVRDRSNADGFMKLDAFASANLFNHLSLKLKVSNLLNSAIFSPPIVDYTQYDAQWPGRVFRLAVSYKI